MSATLVHRGPDSEGLVLRRAGRARGAAALDHRPRDAATSRSRTRTGRVHVVQNGEIYNYRELRARARARGAPLPRRTATPRSSSTSTRSTGPASRSACAGMFAIALWDAPRAAARARARPLRDQAALLPRRPAALLFASELRALPARRGRPRRSRGVPRVQLDPRAADDLPRDAQASARAPARLGGRGARARAVRAAGPVACGRCPRRRRGRARRGATSPAARFGPRPPRRGRSRRRPALRRRRLGAPRRARGAGELGEPVRTFSIGFEERSFDELAARGTSPSATGPTTASSCCARTRRCSSPRSPRPSTSRSRTRPRCRPTSCPSSPRRRSRSRSRVRVATSCSAATTPTPPTSSPRASAVSRTAAAARRTPPESTREGELRLQGEALRPLRAPAAARATSRVEGDLLPGRTRGAHGPRGTFDPVDLLRERFAETEGAEQLARLQDVDLGIYLVDDLLVKTDRASMAHSLEARVPFLDTVVTNLALALPTRHKVRGLSKKVLLRKAAAPLLPARDRAREETRLLDSGRGVAPRRPRAVRARDALARTRSGGRASSSPTPSRDSSTTTSADARTAAASSGGCSRSRSGTSATSRGRPGTPSRRPSSSSADAAATRRSRGRRPAELHEGRARVRRARAARQRRPTPCPYRPALRRALEGRLLRRAAAPAPARAARCAHDGACVRGAGTGLRRSWLRSSSSSPAT